MSVEGEGPNVAASESGKLCTYPVHLRVTPACGNPINRSSYLTDYLRLLSRLGGPAGGGVAAVTLVVLFAVVCIVAFAYRRLGGGSAAQATRGRLNLSMISVILPPGDSDPTANTTRDASTDNRPTWPPPPAGECHPVPPLTAGLGPRLVLAALAEVPEGPGRPGATAEAGTGDEVGSNPDIVGSYVDSSSPGAAQQSPEGQPVLQLGEPRGVVTLEESYDSSLSSSLSSLDSLDGMAWSEV